MFVNIGRCLGSNLSNILYSLSILQSSKPILYIVHKHVLFKRKPNYLKTHEENKQLLLK